VRALVLVGGIGTRLRPLTYDAPKQMLPIVERPMIARVLEWLSKSAVTEVVLSLGYRPDAFIDAFPGGAWAGVKLAYAVEPEPLDTAGAIRFAAEVSGMTDEQIIVINGDVLTSLDVDELVRLHDAHGGVATVALTPVDDPSAYGVVPTTGSGAVIAFIEKPPPGEAPTNCINAGTYVLDPEAIAMIPSGRRSSIEREVFPALVEKRALYAFEFDAYWIDTGTPRSYIQAQLDIVHGERCDVELDGVRSASGRCIVAEDAEAGGALESVFLGSRARTADGATVERSVIGAGAIVEAGATVRDAILLPGSRVAAGGIVNSGVLGWGAVVSGGSMLSGGAMIGRGAVLGAGDHLDGAAPST
jgi:mannose-1-phosphate guanylyltransferase